MVLITAVSLALAHATFTANMSTTCPPVCVLLPCMSVYLSLSPSPSLPPSLSLPLPPSPSLSLSLSLSLLAMTLPRAAEVFPIEKHTQARTREAVARRFTSSRMSASSLIPMCGKPSRGRGLTAASTLALLTHLGLTGLWGSKVC